MRDLPQVVGCLPPESAMVRSLGFGTGDNSTAHSAFATWEIGRNWLGLYMQANLVITSVVAMEYKFNIYITAACS